MFDTAQSFEIESYLKRLKEDLEDNFTSKMEEKFKEEAQKPQHLFYLAQSLEIDFLAKQLKKDLGNNFTHEMEWQFRHDAKRPKKISQDLFDLSQTFLHQQKRKKEPPIQLADKDKIKAALEEHYEDRTTASETSFINPEEKPSGVTTGYKAKKATSPEGSSFLIKIAQKSPNDIPDSTGRPRSWDNISFVNEFIIAPLYKRTLYSRTPVIAGVDFSAADKIALRSKFLDEFQTLSAFTQGELNSIGFDSAKLKDVEGSEKVFAAILTWGESDAHASNLGVMRTQDGGLVLAKIDHGFSGCKFYTDQGAMLNRLAANYSSYGYQTTLPLSVSKLKEAVDQITSSFSDEEIEVIIKARIAELKRIGFNIRSLSLYFDLDDKTQSQKCHSLEELEEYYLKHFKENLATMKKLSARLEIISKIDFDPKDSVKESEWKNGRWLQDIKGEDPIAWAKRHNKTIEGFEPDVWLAKQRLLNKISALTDREPVDTYQSKLLAGADFKNSDQIETLASFVEGYELRLFTFTEFKDFDIDKIKALTSHGAVEAYRHKLLNIAEIKDLKPGEIKDRISQAIDVYKSRLLAIAGLQDQQDLKDLKDLDIDKIEALTSREAVWAYRYHLLGFLELKDLEASEIKDRISKAVNAYKPKLLTSAGLQDQKDLKDLDVDKIAALTSNEVREAYRSGLVTVADLKDLDVDKIVALTSYEAREAYRSGLVTVADLKDLDTDKVKALTSSRARYAYESKFLMATDLKGLNVGKIEALISDDALEAYRSRSVSVADLKDLGPDNIKALLSREAIFGYGYKLFTVADFKGLDIGRIGALTSYEAQEAYRTGSATVADLKELAPDKIKALLSKKAINGYNSRLFTVSDLKDLDVGKIGVLTSDEVLKAYRTGSVTVADLKDLAPDKIKALLSRDAMYGYESRLFTATDLKDLDIGKIEALTSRDAIEAYRTRLVTVADLKGLEIDQIKVLTSRDATDAYQTGSVTAAELKEFEADKIKVFTSAEVQELYKAGAKFKDLNELFEHNRPMFDILTSSYAAAAYNSDLTFDAVKELALSWNSLSLEAMENAKAWAKSIEHLSDDVNDLEDGERVRAVYDSALTLAESPFTSTESKVKSYLDAVNNVQNIKPPIPILSLDSCLNVFNFIPSLAHAISYAKPHKTAPHWAESKIKVRKAEQPVTPEIDQGKRAREFRA